MKFLNQWREEDEEDVSRYWVTLREKEGAGNLERKHKIAPCGELALE
jgi:hypothetical protein